MPRISISPAVRLAAGVVVAAVVLAFAGIGVYSLVDGGNGSPQAAVTSSPVPVATPTPSATSTAATATPTASASATALPATPTPEPEPTFTPTPDFTLQPSVEVIGLDPPLGAHIETASVDIRIDTEYQAGGDSNVLGWSLLYCAGPNDCNTYGFQNSVDIVPGAKGSATLGAPFAAGGNYLRPIVVCQYTVTIGHFVTPEAQWQSQLANDARCHPDASGPRVKVLDVSPPLGSVISAGDVIRVNLEYDAGPATRALARYSVERCFGDLFAFRTADVQPGTSGVVTILVPVTEETRGTLHHIDAQLLNGDLPVADYSFGPC
jgi:hypothetical protein